MLWFRGLAIETHTKARKKTVVFDHNFRKKRTRWPPIFLISGIVVTKEQMLKKIAIFQVGLELGRACCQSTFLRIVEARNTPGTMRLVRVLVLLWGILVESIPLARLCLDFRCTLGSLPRRFGRSRCESFVGNVSVNSIKYPCHSFAGQIGVIRDDFALLHITIEFA